MISGMRYWIIVFGATAVVGLVIAGCQSNSRSAALQQAPGEGAAPTSPVLGAEEEEPGVLAAGAQLWERNCIRCHNPRTPSSLSDAQWSVVMHHMRVRASLTAEEHESILRFLQAAN